MRPIRNIGMRRLDGLAAATSVGNQFVAGDRTIAVRIDLAKVGLLVFRQLALHDFAVFVRVETSKEIILGHLRKNDHYEKRRKEQRAERHASLHHDLLES